MFAMTCGKSMRYQDKNKGVQSQTMKSFFTDSGENQTEIDLVSPPSHNY